MLKFSDWCNKCSWLHLLCKIQEQFFDSPLDWSEKWSNENNRREENFQNKSIMSTLKVSSLADCSLQLQLWCIRSYCKCRKLLLRLNERIVDEKLLHNFSRWKSLWIFCFWFQNTLRLIASTRQFSRSAVKRAGSVPEGYAKIKLTQAAFQVSVAEVSKLFIRLWTFWHFRKTMACQST